MKHLTLSGLKPRRTVPPAISLPVARAAYSVKGRQALKGQQAPLVPAAIGRSGNLRRRPPGAPSAAAAPTAVAAQPQAVPTSGELEGASVSDSSQNQSARQLIVESWIGLEVDNIDAAVRHVETIAAQRGGWVESAEIYGEAGYRSASVQLRVPADRLDNVLDTLRGLGRVTDEGVSSTDVTERLIDNEARLSAWHAQESRLVTLLENAPTVEDIIQIEQRIAQVRSDIEYVEATQRNLTNRVATSSHHRQPAPTGPGSRPILPTVCSTCRSATRPQPADAITVRVAALRGYVGQNGNMKRIVAGSWTWSSSSNPLTWHNSWTTRQPWDLHRGGS